MKKCLRYFVWIVLVLSAAAQPRRVVPLGSGGKRVALVIGNDKYLSLPPLSNGVRDAQAMNTALSSVDFDVILVTNGTRENIEEAVKRFVKAIQPGDVALLYYSGHAVQIDGENYLSPIDLRADDDVQVRNRSVKIGEVVEEMGSRGADLQIVVLDACRDNPFSKQRSMGGTGGLAVMSAGKGTFLAYATAPGKPADDNSKGSNGLYTGYLLKALSEPGLVLEQVFKRVSGDVQTASKGKQIPWIASSVQGDFYFRKAETETAEPTDAVAEKPATASAPPAASPALHKARRALRDEFGKLALKGSNLNDRLNSIERATKNSGGLPAELRRAWEGMNQELDRVATALEQDDLTAAESEIKKVREYIATIEDLLLKQ
jgi:uncharacterized caspase-like protein